MINTTSSMQHLSYSMNLSSRVSALSEALSDSVLLHNNYYAAIVDGQFTGGLTLQQHIPQ